MDFAGRHVVITGGTAGIGLATGGKIARNGGRVTLIARRVDLLTRNPAQLGKGAVWAAADVGDKGQLLAALDAAVEVNGPIDGLFLNAAQPRRFHACLE